jgi:hypothetical protein
MFWFQYYWSLARSRFSSSDFIEYLRDFEYICKSVLAHESGGPGVQFNEKTASRKSRETVPLILMSQAIVKFDFVCLK